MLCLVLEIESVLATLMMVDVDGEAWTDAISVWYFGRPPAASPSSLFRAPNYWFVFCILSELCLVLALIVILENGGKLKSLVMPTVPRPEMIRNLIRYVSKCLNLYSLKNRLCYKQFRLNLPTLNAATNILLKRCVCFLYCVPTKTADPMWKTPVHTRQVTQSWNPDVFAISEDSGIILYPALDYYHS